MPNPGELSANIYLSTKQAKDILLAHLSENPQVINVPEGLEVHNVLDFGKDGYTVALKRKK